MRSVARALVSAVGVGLAACSSMSADPGLASVPSACREAVVVRAVPGAPTRAMATAWERRAGGWVAVMGPWPATVGRTGIVDAAAKREGDGHTPGGVLHIGTAFGYAASVPTGLGYRQATADDWWVDEPSSPAYNTWVVGKPAVSAEAMRRVDALYELGCVLEWNTAPVVPGRGSAIFLHVWKGPDQPTAGCVALAREHVAQLLAWFDAVQRPVVVAVP